MFAWLRRKPAPPSEEKLRVIEALVDYPVYAPPIRRSKAQSLKEAHDAYTTYFFENRSERVAALRKFLAKFDVTLSLDDANVKAVSAWCPVYADLLVDGLQHQESDELWCAYNWFEVPWTGAMIGFNPIFDLGVFMGECILSRNPRLKWRPLVNPELGKGASHIIYSSSGRPFDPMKWTYTECKNVHSARITRTNWSETRLWGYMQAQLMPVRGKKVALTDRS